MVFIRALMDSNSRFRFLLGANTLRGIGPKRRMVPLRFWSIGRGSPMAPYYWPTGLSVILTTKVMSLFIIPSLRITTHKKVFSYWTNTRTMRLNKKEKIGTDEICSPSAHHKSLCCCCNETSFQCIKLLKVQERRCFGDATNLYLC